MNKSGPVIVIEDDNDDQEFFKTAFDTLKYDNDLIFFPDGHEALEFLKYTEILPFMIISDINMPKLDGIALKKKLNEDCALEIKCIPFLYFTTASDLNVVIDAYSRCAQGFFIKQTSIEELQKTIASIMDYWKRCAAPNHYTSPTLIKELSEKSKKSSNDNPKV